MSGKGITCDRDPEAGNMEAVSGMTTFKEYNKVMMIATDQMVGQEWNLDGTGKNWMLRNGEDRMIGVWMGEKETVGEGEEVLYVHKEIAKAVKQQIVKVHKLKPRHREYKGESQLWYSGKYNPRWTKKSAWIGPREVGGNRQKWRRWKTKTRHGIR